VCFVEVLLRNESLAGEGAVAELGSVSTDQVAALALDAAGRGDRVDVQNLPALTVPSLT